MHDWNPMYGFYIRSMGVLGPVQQPGSYWDSFSGLPHRCDSLWLDAELLGHSGPRYGHG